MLQNNAESVMVREVQNMCGQVQNVTKNEKNQGGQLVVRNDCA